MSMVNNNIIYNYLLIFSEVVRSICEKEGIPQFLFRNYRKRHNRYKPNYYITYNMYPSQKLLAKAFLEITNSYGWKTFTFIYNSDDGKCIFLPVYLYEIKLFLAENPKKYQKLLQSFSLYAHTGVGVRTFNSTADYRLLWKNLRAEKRIIIACSHNDSKNLLQTLINSNLTTQLNVSNIYNNVQLCYKCIFSNN